MWHNTCIDLFIQCHLQGNDASLKSISLLQSSQVGQENISVLWMSCSPDVRSRPGHVVSVWGFRKQWRAAADAKLLTWRVSVIVHKGSRGSDVPKRISELWIRSNRFAGFYSRFHFHVNLKVESISHPQLFLGGESASRRFDLAAGRRLVTAQWPSRKWGFMASTARPGLGVTAKVDLVVCSRGVERTSPVSFTPTFNSVDFP